jgi:hypothetical protein
MNVILLKPAEVIVTTTSRRKYPDSFYAWGIATYKEREYDMGDPFPSSNFPRYEAVTHVATSLSKDNKIQVQEKEYRALFKGIKNGATIYASYAENLEKRGVEFI